VRCKPQFAGILLAALMMPFAHANTDELRLHGQGTMRWLGLKIYDAQLFAPPQFSADQTFERPFALELTYARNFSGQSIAERSLEEIKRLGIGDAVQHGRWLAQMQAIFPNVSAGDRLRGVHQPGQGVSFYKNGLRIGAIDDRDFSRAFFSIWLAPRTAEPALRNRLLGLASSDRP
jgi:hypothetical protein